MECKHIWLSDEKGVTCTACGLHLPPNEFGAFLKGEIPIQKAPTRKRKADKKDA